MQRRKPIRVTIAGNEWTVRRARLKRVYGYCDHAKREIVIDAATAPDIQWQTLIHEAMHASAPDLSEDAILRIEADIVAVLRGCGDWFGAARGTDARPSNRPRQPNTQSPAK